MRRIPYITNSNHRMPAKTDHGPAPYAVNISHAAQQNQCFRTALWTGCFLQMTLMCIPPKGEIGMEVHTQIDQYIRVEEGRCKILLGYCKDHIECAFDMSVNDAVFVPAGTWHNIINLEECPLKLSSVYAPPQHPRGTVHMTKADAEHAEV